MSKQIRLRMTALLLVGLSLTALLVRAPVARSQAQGIAPAAARNAAVVETTAAVLRETSEIRELPILREVRSGTQSRSEIERMVIRNLDEDTTPEETRASELALKKLGLVPADFQLRSFLVKLLTEQVAGYYEPRTGQFYLADWIDLDGQKPVMAHELTHALQDQHFDLRRFERWPKGDSDAELAAHALIEGDAQLAMSFYIARNPLRALVFMKSMEASGASSEQIDHAPRALRASLLFPYDQGLNWVTQLYKRGGWAAVTGAFKQLPQSTEQILHPEKYLAHEPPIKVNVPDIASMLGKGWKRVDYDVDGEWSYYLILEEYLKSDAESKRAAAGWGGDRYALYEGPRAGDLLMAQRSVWDTENDAIEFFDAYAKRTERRYEHITPADSAAAATIRAWHTNEGGVRLERRGQNVLIVEGIPPSINPVSLSRALWR